MSQGQQGQGQQNYKPIPKTPFNEFKLRLFGPQVDGARRPPTLAVSVVKNQPRIDVFTNVDGDRDNGRLTAAMDTFTMHAVLDEIEKMADAEPDSRVQFENRTGRPQETRVVSNTHIGKDKEGRVYISIISPDRPKIKFAFLPSLYHTMIHKDGTRYEEAELSVVYAKAWVKAMRGLLPTILTNYYVEPEPRPQGGGGGGRPNGGGGGNRGGSQSYSSGGGDGGNFGDDLPM